MVNASQIHLRVAHVTESAGPGAETRRALIAVVGDANLSAGNSDYDQERAATAEALGCALVDAGARVLTGGKVTAARTPFGNPVKLHSHLLSLFKLV